MKNSLKLKAIQRIAGIITLAAIIGLGMVSCDNGGGKLLDTPKNVRIDADTFTLKWDSVSGASKYEIDINGELFQVSTTQYDLKKLTEEPKLYTLKVKAIAGASESANSTALECEAALYVFTFGSGGGRAVGPAGSAITGLTNYGKTLDKIVIPASVGGITISSIGEEAFKGNTIIVVVVFLSPTPPEVADDAFDGCTNLDQILVPPGLEDDYKDNLPNDLGNIVEEDDSLVDTVTITGLTAWNGADVTVGVFSRAGLDAMESGNDEYEEPEVAGWGAVENGSVTVTLMAHQEIVTKGTDGKEEYDYIESYWSPEAGKNYWLRFSIAKKTGGTDPVYGTDEADYLYSNGQSFNVNLDNKDFDMIAFMKTVPYFDFSQSSVALSKFWQAPEGMFGGYYEGSGYEEIGLDAETLGKVLSAITKTTVTIGTTVTTWGGVATAAGYTGSDSVGTLNKAITGYYQQEYENQGAYAYGVEIFTYGTDGKRSEVDANTTLLVNQKANIFVGIDYSYGGGGGGNNPGGDPDGKG